MDSIFSIPTKSPIPHLAFVLSCLSNFSFRHPSLLVFLYREIQRAMETLQQLDLRQSAAVEARIELDLRIGAAFTRFQTLRLGRRFTDLKSKVLSYGTVTIFF